MIDTIHLDPVALRNSFFPRHINVSGLTIIKTFESLQLRPYQDVNGIWTIGYGHTRSVYAGMIITPHDADVLLQDDVQLVERAVQRLVTVPLNDNQFSALVSFVFNVGVMNFEKSSLLRLLNQSWYMQVPAQFMRWNQAKGEVLGGLSRRRAAEAQLWKSEISGG